jgi:hypothetical protein
MASSSLPALPCDKIICLGKSGVFFAGRKRKRRRKGRRN